MKKILQFAGLAGVIIFVLGVVVAIVQQKLTMIAAGHLVAGSSLVLAGIIANGAEIKEYVSRRSVRMGPQVLLQAGLLLLVLLLVNLIAFRHDRTFDTTDRQLYTLTPATLRVGNSLPGPVRVISSMPGGGSPQVRQRLQLYASTFPNFKLVSIDPDKNEDMARAEALPPQAGVMFKFNGRNIWITKFDESEITNALVKVSRKFTPKVWFTTGHLEPDLKDTSPTGLSILADALTMQGFQLEPADLSTKTDIPPDVSLIAIVGPAMAFSPAEIKLLDFYLSQGGCAIVMLDPLLDPRAATGLESFLQAYGVNVVPNLVFDPLKHLSRDQSGLWIVPEYLADFPITSQISSARAVIYMSRSLELASPAPMGANIVPLIATSSGAFAKTINLAAVPTMTPEQSKAYFRELMSPGRQGESQPFNLAMAVTSDHTPPGWKRASALDREWQMRMVVFGGSSIIRNMAFNIPFNNEIMTNAFNWAAGAVKLETVATKSRGSDRMVLEEKQMNWILYVSVLVLPEIFMIIGLAVWWRKR